MKQRVKRIQVYLPPEIAAHFQERSDQTLAPVSALVRQFIIKYFDQEILNGKVESEPDKN